MSESEPKQRIDPLRPIIESAFYDAFGIAAIRKTREVMAEHDFGEMIEVALMDQRFNSTIKKYVPEFRYEIIFPSEEIKRKFLRIYSVVHSFTEQERAYGAEQLSSEAQEEIQKIIEEIKDQQAQS